MGLTLLHTVTVELAERKPASGFQWIKRGHYHHMSEFLVEYGQQVSGVEKIIWQPLYSNGPKIDFRAEPAGDEACQCRVECWDIAWPHLKFDLHLLGNQSENSDALLTVLLENEQLKRELAAFSEQLKQLETRISELEANRAEAAEAADRNRAADELDQYLVLR